MNVFSHKINTWYRLNKREFPWRKTKNPYHIWLSEIILQQTKTEQGLPYYLKFINAYPTIKQLADANQEAVLKLWQGLGYYSRALNLHHTAKYITYDLNGKFPENYKELISLKGIGDYTASAIASICFDKKEAVLDGNVFRVLARYFGIETDITSGNGKKEFKKLALNLLPKTGISDYNQAVMDFGATQCSPKKPKCNTCILKDTCYAFLHQKTDKLPVKKKKKTAKKRFFNYLVYLDPKNQTIINKREKKGIWKNLYEFPLIESHKKLTTNQLKQKIEQSENHNLLKTEISKFNEHEIVHKLSHQHIHTTFWIIQTNYILTNGLSFKEITKLPMAILTHNFIESFTNS